MVTLSKPFSCIRIQNVYYRGRDYFDGDRIKKNDHFIDSSLKTWNKIVTFSWQINLWKEHSGQFYLYLPTYLLKSLSHFTIYTFNSIHYKAKFIKMLGFFSKNLITLCIDTITSLGSYLTANISESGPMPTPWKFLDSPPVIPSC